MSKVKITQEQANEIEIRKQIFSNESTIKKHLEGWECIRILNLLTLDELIRALYIGYEIEEEFKSGDWVHVSFKSGSKIAKILNSYHGVIQFYDNENLPNIKIDNQTRHATPEEIAEEKQRRLWHENGREVGEFKKNDIIFNKNLGGLDVMTGFADVKYTDEYEIVCFSHDRKDLKND